MYTHGPNCLPGPKGGAWRVGQAFQPDCQAGKPDLHHLSPVPFREELVDRIRREIAAGTYDTPEKWQAALERFFQRLYDNQE